MSIFSKKFLTATTVAVVLSLAGCGDEGGGGGGAAPGGGNVTPQAVAGQLPGTWNFKTVVYTPSQGQQGDPEQYETQGTLKLTANTWELDRSEAGGEKRQAKGTYTVAGEVLKTKTEGNAQEAELKFKIVQQGNTEFLTIEAPKSYKGQNGVIYDVTDILSREVPGQAQQPAPNPTPAPAPAPTPGPAPGPGPGPMP